MSSCKCRTYLCTMYIVYSYSASKKNYDSIFRNLPFCCYFFHYSLFNHVHISVTGFATTSTRTISISLLLMAGNLIEDQAFSPPYDLAPSHFPLPFSPKCAATKIPFMGIAHQTTGPLHINSGKFRVQHSSVGSASTCCGRPEFDTRIGTPWRFFSC
jgi:hypothetical protein